MSGSIVSVRGLGKQYQLGSATRHDTLRDHIAHGVRRLVSRKNDKPKSEGDFIWALKDVSFEIGQGEVVGIIGRNGAGKSTLLKILSQITEPSVGEVRVRGRVASLLEVGTGFHPELTGRENIFLNGAILGMTRAEIRKSFDEIVAFSEVEQFLDTPVKRYSSGMYVRLAFAVAAHLEPEVLVVDEVLAVGDAAFRKKCMGKMGEVASLGRTVLLVSHNMGAISSLCDRGLLVDNGRIAFDGPAHSAVQAYNSSQNVAGTGQSEQGVIYAIPLEGVLSKKCAITRLEMLDADGNPRLHLATGDTVALRVTFHLSTPAPRCGVEIMFNTGDGGRLLMLANDPDSGFPLKLEPGVHSIECVIEKFPLSAGDFFISGAITIPYEEFLARWANLGQVTVVAADVYDSGFVITTDQSIIVTDHHWRVARGAK
ncbi:MAG: ABC transporter ATP-binding protein [Chthoniobacter sp.]|nr:ABC transporter ATP-binding protein [Chthoniobacter sp.]